MRGTFLCRCERKVRLFDDQFAVHTFVAEAANMAAVKLIGARRLRDEFNRGGFLLFELEAFLRRLRTSAVVALVLVGVIAWVAMGLRAGPGPQPPSTAP